MSVASIEYVNSEACGLSGEIAAPPGKSPAWSKAIDRLLEIRALGDGWDGARAIAPPNEVVDSAIDLIWLLRQQSDSEPPSRIIPTVRGIIVMEWYFRGYYQSAEIETPYCADWMLQSPAGTFEHWSRPWQKREQKSGCGADEPTYAA